MALAAQQRTRSSQRSARFGPLASAWVDMGAATAHTSRDGAAGLWRAASVHRALSRFIGCYSTSVSCLGTMGEASATKSHTCPRCGVLCSPHPTRMPSTLCMLSSAPGATRYKCSCPNLAKPHPQQPSPQHCAHIRRRSRSWWHT